MGKKILVRDANLHNHPGVVEHEAEHTHVSAGDMHGNSLKLIYTLIEEGILEVSPEKKYRRLHDIYYTPTDQLTVYDLNTFQTIIKDAAVKTDRSLTLIGDELADRGNNDYFTLLVLKRLHDAGLDMDIMVSNHSAEFIRDYEKPYFTGVHYLFGNQGQSLTNMQQLIACKLVNEEEVRLIIEDCYKLMVKAIGYTVSPEGEITLFSHAPIGLETIEALAKKFGIHYSEESPKDLIIAINAINERIHTLFTEKTLATLIDEEGGSNPNAPIPLTQPLMRLVWNRAVGDELRTEPRSRFKVSFVHGHIGDGEILQHGTTPLPSHQNLDGMFGKDNRLAQTGRDRYGDIRHFTRQSSELTAKQLATSLADARTNIFLQETSITRLPYFEIRDTLMQINAFISNQNKPTNYKVAFEKTETLLRELKETAEAYYCEKTTTEDYKKSLDNLAARVNTHDQHVAFDGFVA